MHDMTAGRWSEALVSRQHFQLCAVYRHARRNGYQEAIAMMETVL